MAPVFYKSHINRPGYDKRVDRFFGLSPRWTAKQQAQNEPDRWEVKLRNFMAREKPQAVTCRINLDTPFHEISE